MFRNIPRTLLSSTSYNNKLGIRKINDNIQRKVDLANIDNCGIDYVIPISSELIDKINKQKIEEKKKKEKNRSNNTIEHLVKDYNQRWKQNNSRRS